MLKTTSRHKKYWEERKINWKTSYFDTFNHPHRDLIIDKLKKWKMSSIVEIGCASGPNLYRIQQDCPWMQFGGVDISYDAIETAKQLFPNCAVLTQSSFTDIFLSDKSSDIVLTDMSLIYADPFTINRVLKEIKRIVRNYVIFVEFHSDSLWQRNKLRFISGYHAYNYKKLLSYHGFYGIDIEKITESQWPGGHPQKQFAYLITAKL